MIDHSKVIKGSLGKLTVGKVNLIRYGVIEACRIALKEGRQVCWIDVKETRTSREPENS